ncbi:hypothetical protein F3Y22_tig00110267pilonHSYRG00019 [Hibiscus syriacus]|uniref:Uncharacterized protein n=1 Tax=Hibiscus syriacus TaxID=106335 RepID=A0A6A3B9S6_HIBSY|nr:hypothetical protein F3Y22_tig00110267pilonHSYRG00019 [Hibiscus syriacus]
MTVGWAFLDLMLEKMSFGVRWRGWIRSCISSASISVLVNGSPTERFRIKKGLRQGCPLFPLLFNIVAEGLSSMLFKAMSIGLFEGMPEQLCLPRQFGGLGLVDFKVKNKALLYKWLWRYGSERDHLWRKVIKEEYENGNDCILPLNTNARNKSWIWRDIVKPLSPSLADSDPFALNIRVGGGRLLEFWSNKWVEFDEFVPEDWEVQLRRPVFDWEAVIWENFLISLEECCLGLCLSDFLRCSISSSGQFEAKDIVKLNLGNRTQCEQWKNFWSGAVPYNIELFAWRVLLRRAPTKVELSKRDRFGVIGVACGVLIVFSQRKSGDFMKHGLVTAQFSRSIGASDPLSTELLAIKEACLFFDSVWAGKKNLIVESDCSTTVLWIKNLHQASLAFKDLTKACIDVLSSCGAVKGVVLPFVDWKQIKSVNGQFDAGDGLLFLLGFFLQLEEGVASWNKRELDTWIGELGLVRTGGCYVRFCVTGS